MQVPLVVCCCLRYGDGFVDTYIFPEASIIRWALDQLQRHAEEQIMRISGVGQTDVGLVRDHNEDYYILDRDLGLYIVCDGMGGHAAGEVASENAAKTVLAYVQERKEILNTFDDSPAARIAVTQLLKDAISESCATVYKMSVDNQSYAGMGTTLTAILCVGNVAAIGHVGDSRLYLQRDGKVYKLSTDHTLVTELLYSGVLTPETAKHHPSNHILTRAIGLQSSVKVDSLLFDLIPNDTFLICSDGLSNSVNDPGELSNILQLGIEEIPAVLIELARQRDGSDNITSLIVRAEADEELSEEAQQRAEDLQLRYDTLRQVYLFEHLDLQELSKVMNITSVEHCEAGDVLIEEGSTSETMYIALEGMLSVSRGGQEITVLESGKHVGEMALLNKRPRSATVRAVEPSRLLKLERAGFTQLLLSEPLIGAKLLWRLAQELSLRLDETNQAVFGDAQSSEDYLPAPFRTDT